MRRYFSVFVGIAVVMILAGVGSIGSGAITQRKWDRLEAARAKRCAASKLTSHGNCCVLCGRPGEFKRFAGVGGRRNVRSFEVFLCKEHVHMSGQKGYNIATQRRSREQLYFMGFGGLSILLGGTLLLVLLLTRRKWAQQIAEYQEWGKSLKDQAADEASGDSGCR